MPSHVNVSEQNLALFQRSNEAEIYLSDVFPRRDPSSEPAWWQYTDFDAVLTTDGNNKGLNDVKYNIAEHPWLARYGLVLIDDLVIGQQRRVIRNEEIGNFHPDALTLAKRSLGAVVVVANQAFRDDAHTADGKNGEDFYLAITTSGLEICVTPLDFLSSLDARNRLLALYRIPTKGHPEYNGDREQFRSSHVAKTRQYPGHLDRVFEYSDTEALLKAKQACKHHSPIPQFESFGRVAFVDRFANIKLELPNMSLLRQARIGHMICLVIRNQGVEHMIHATVAVDLHTAQRDEFVIYENCSDIRDPSSQIGFAELAIRVNGNPATSTRTAMFRLLEAIPDLDLATAEFELKPTA